MISFLSLIMIQALSGTRVSTVQEVCNQLSSELGRTVSASRALADQNVFIDRHGKPAQTVLTALAECLHATVQSDASGLLLVRSKSDIAGAKTSIINERSRWIEQTLDGVEKRRKRVLGSNSSPSSPGEINRHFEERLNQQIAADHMQAGHPEVTPLAELLPSQQLLVGLLRVLGPRRLSEASLQETTIFEDKPIRGNESLPDHLDLNLKYQSGMQLFEHAELPKWAVNGSAMWSTEIAPFALGWGKLTKPIDRLRLSEVCLGCSMIFQLSGYDDSGNLVAKAELVVPHTPIGSKPSNGAVISETTKPRTRRVSLAPEGAAAALFAASARPNVQPFPEWFLNPDKEEPLNLFVLTALQALDSENPDKCVAIEVSDLFWPTVLQCISHGELDLNRLEDVIDQWNPFEKVTSPEIAAWHPLDAFFAEACRSDRKELARFAKQAWHEKSVGLRATGRLYRYGSSRPGMLTNVWEFDARVGLGGWTTPGKNLTARIYRLIGAINDQDWARLEGGHVMTVGELNAAEELNEVLRQEYGVVPESKFPYAEIYQHGSELFPQGISPETPISVKALNTQLIQDWPQRSGSVEMWAPIYSNFGKPMKIRTIGMNYMGGHAEPRSNREEYESSLANRHFRLGHADDTNLVIGLPLGLWIGMQSRGTGVPDSGDFAYKDLPSDLRDFFWKAAYDDAVSRAKQIEAGLSSSHVGQSQTAGPPPN